MLVNISILSLFWPFSYSLMQFPPSILKLSTQHPPYCLKLSTQHQPALTRIENWAILPTQGLQFSSTFIRAFSNISAYTKIAQFYSTKNTSMNKFLAQNSSPCLMLGGIPPASLSEGWLCYQFWDHTVAACGPVKVYCDTDFGWHWLRLVAWQHQPIIWTNVDLPSEVYCGINLRAMPRKVLI